MFILSPVGLNVNIHAKLLYEKLQNEFAAEW
jgi:hypothetical protein